MRKTNRERLFASTLLAGVASLGVPLAVGAAGVMVSATDAMAQDYTTGGLRGRVLDQDGNPVSGANVTVRSQAQGFSRTTTTNANGEFTLQVLPVGEYTASISASGYSPAESRDLRVDAGGSNVYAFDLVTGGGDEIVVTAARAQLSFNETTTGLQLNVEELTERVPVGQNVLNLALLAPTAVQGGASNRNGAFGNEPAVGGASVAENAFFVNGLNITNFENGFGGALVPFEFYETVEVKTGGYQAEFGRSTGAVINATTKSGSNDWMLRLSGNMDPTSLQEQQPRTLNDANEFDEIDRQIATLEIGGPIIRDRLFFYVLGQHREIENQFASITGASFNVDRTDDPFYAAKVDFNITDDHRIEGTYWDTTRETVRSINSFAPAVGSGGTINAAQPGAIFQQGGEAYVFRYTGSFTDWFTLSAAYGQNEDADSTLPENTTDPFVLDNRQGNIRVSSQTAGSSDLVLRSREFTRVDADFFFDLMGEHHLRAGYDTEDLELGHFNSPTGGFLNPYNEGTGVGDPYGLAVGDSFALNQVFVSGGSFMQTNSAYYIQDSWDVLDNLTINLGVRLDQFDLNNADGVEMVSFDEEIGPRLGFSWDPGNDGTNRVFGSYGRYFLPLAANTAFRNGAAELFFNEIVQISEQGTPAIYTDDYDATTGLPIGGFGAPVVGFPGASVCPAQAVNSGVAACEVFADGEANLPITYLDQQLESTYEDEFIIGWEHRFDNDWTIGITGVWQTLGRVSEDVAIDRAVREFCADPANGFSAQVQAECNIVWDGQHQYSLTNPGEDLTIVLDAASGGFATVDDDGGGPGTGNGIIEELDGLTVDLSAADLGYPKPQRDYYGVTFDFERPWDGQWMLQGSYTWSLSEGNYEGQAKSDNGQDDVGITTDFDLLGLIDGAYGHLPNHRAHQFKLFGAYAVTEAFTVGANVVVQSPREFGCLGRHRTDTDAADYGATSWYCSPDGTALNSELTPRASQTESDWLTQVDLSFRYTLPEAVPGELTLRADVFNVFNSDAVLAIEERGENTNGSVRVLPAAHGGGPAYGFPTAYQQARFVRVGFAWEF